MHTPHLNWVKTLSRYLNRVQSKAKRRKLDKSWGAVANSNGFRRLEASFLAKNH